MGDTTRTGRNLDRTQSGQTQPGQGHNPDRDVTRTGQNPDRDTTRTRTDSVFNPDTEKIISEYVVPCASLSLYSDLESTKICISSQSSDIIKLFITEIKYILTGRTL